MLEGARNSNFLSFNTGEIQLRLPERPPWRGHLQLYCRSHLTLIACKVLGLRLQQTSWSTVLCSRRCSFGLSLSSSNSGVDVVSRSSSITCTFEQVRQVSQGEGEGEIHRQKHQRQEYIPAQKADCQQESCTSMLKNESFGEFSICLGEECAG